MQTEPLSFLTFSDIVSKQISFDFTVSIYCFENGRIKKNPEKIIYIKKKKFEHYKRIELKLET